MSKVLITSGPTRQYLDPVRYLTNASSGRMGAALAQACLDAGIEVIVVSGPVEIEYPKGAEVVNVTSTDEMHIAAMQRFGECVGAIGAAAPCDYKPFTVLPGKMSKEDFIRTPEAHGELMLQLRETPDIMAALGAMKRAENDPKGWQWLVAFALETSDFHMKALQKLQRKHCDLIVVNGPSSLSGHDADIEVLDANGSCLASAHGNKYEVATKIISVIRQFARNRG
ncbi:MAG: phosphopantothenoylcysteine decarboxylase [Thermoguttaceae bacterium]|jgi:phosphopantothenoylcysteine decarboxylase/phosphopantothenate--cysteine ligase